MIIHSPIFSGSITQDTNHAYANLSGSFSGSFTGIGNFTGLEADSVEFDNILNKPALVSGSQQVIDLLPTGTVSGSSQLTTEFDARYLNTLGDGIVSGSKQVKELLPTGTVSGSSQVINLLPTGTVSGSSQITITESQISDLVHYTDTDFDNRLGTKSTSDVSEGTNLYYTDERVKTKLTAEGVISGSSQVIGILSSLNTYTGSNDTTNTTQNGRLTSLETASGSAITRLTALESETSNLESFTASIDTTIKTKLNVEGVISGSSQILGGSGLVSGSSQIDVTATTNYSTISSHISSTSNPHSVTATQVGLGNVTNESKATMFTSPTFTGTPIAPTAAANTNSTQIATTAYVQQELTDLIGGANEAFDTLLEISASLASGDSTLNTLVDGKLAKASNLSDLTDASTARTNLGLAIGTNVQAYNSTLASVAGGTYSGDDSITTIGTVTAGSVTAILPTGTVSGSSQINVASTTGYSTISSHIANTSNPHSVTAAQVGLGNVDNTSDVNKPVSTAQQTALNLKLNASAVSTFGGTLIDDADASTARTTLGLGSLATLSTVNAATITDNSVGAAELNVTGNGTTAQFLRSDGDGTFTWATPTDTNTTYSVGNGGLTEINFTSARSSKLDGIAAGATNVTNNNQLTNGAGYTTYTSNQATNTTSDVNFNTVNINSTTASTTKTTGALIVDGGVGVAGALNVGGDVVAYASSDRRLKDNIQNIENPIEKVQKLNGVTWDWNSNADELQQSLPNVGVIAQEVEEVFPQLVHNRDNGYKGVDYAKLTGLLIEAIKEQQKQIDELKLQTCNCNK